MTRILPRGLRNNNPLNIRRSGDNWKGLKSKQTDSAFFQFKDMKWGYRAAFIIMKRYVCDYHLLTIVDVINRWAPPHENHTLAYANYVATMSNIPLGRILPSPQDNGALWQRIIHAMAEYENGVKVDWDSIKEGYNLAFNK